MYYGGFLHTETYRLPVVQKRWYIERLVKELNKGNGNNPDPNNPQPSAAATRALHQNSPEIRELQGNLRSQSPSRLRRFT